MTKTLKKTILDLEKEYREFENADLDSYCALKLAESLMGDCGFIAELDKEKRIMTIYYKRPNKKPIELETILFSQALMFLCRYRDFIHELLAKWYRLERGLEMKGNNE